MVVHPPSNLFVTLKALHRPGSIHDTDRITYRCFLPDLTRFVTVCCVASDQNGLRIPSIRTLGGNSAPHEADFGQRAPLTPRLAQPVIRILSICIFARKKTKKTINNLCVLADLCGEIFPGTVSNFGVVSFRRSDTSVESKQR